MADQQGVLVAGELSGDQLSSSSSELLAHGRKLADALGEPLSIALLSDSLGAQPQEAIAYGADKVYAITDPLLGDSSQHDTTLAALANLVTENSPRIVLFGKTPAGLTVGPRLAFRLDAGLAQDCLEVNVDDQKRLVADRPVFGGSCMATVVCEGSPSMAVIRLKTAEPLARDDSRQGEISEIQPGIDASVVKIKILDRVEDKAEGLQLEDAEIIVSGGRGLGGPEPFQNELKDLADILGGAVGSSRAAVDIGWVPYSYQVGLTGKSVAPNIYIAVGISGASQHMAGCSGSKAIVAINKDENANIFKDASYGVVGDWEKVLPAFIETVRELKQ